METKKPTPKPGSIAHPSANTALDEIAHYKNGEIIEIDTSDTRIYCVKKGSVQRAVVLPGCNGLGTLLLAKIEPRPDGGYWNPRLAYLHAIRVGINLVLKAVGETTIQKITEESLRSKDPGQLVRIVTSLLAGHDKQVAETELMIKHQYERAEKEAGGARSANALVESLRQEQEEVQKPAPTFTPNQVKLMCDVGRLRQELKSSQEREAKLREELRKLRSQIKSQETRLQLTAIDLRELNDIRQQLIDQAQWIEQNRPDLPAVQAIQSLVNGPSDDELDAMFDEAFERAAESLQPAVVATKPTSETATAVVIDEAVEGECEAVDDDELLPVDKVEDGTKLIEIGPADASDRQTIPFGRKEGDPQPSPVVIPVLSPPSIALAPVGQVTPQTTKVHDMRAIREEAAKHPSSSIPPQPFELIPVGSEVVQVTRAMDLSEIRRQAAENPDPAQAWNVVTVPSQAPPHETQGRPWTDSGLDEETLDYVRQPVQDGPPMRPKQETLMFEDGVPPPPDPLPETKKKGG